MKSRNLDLGNHKNGRRPAFTLIELVIVIAIIAILAALTTGVAMRFYGIQQQRNTEVTITKVSQVLERQWQAVIDQASKEPLPPTSASLALSWFNPSYNPANPSGPGNAPGIFQMANGDMKIARVIWIKARLRQEFPMNYSEILYATPSLFPQPLPGGALPALQVYVNALNNGPIANGFVPGNEPTPAENSSCLLMSLTLVNRAGITFSADDLGSQALADTDKDGLNEIVDGWKTPIIFFRWPFGNDEVQSLNPNPAAASSFTFADPQDPTGLLVTPYPYDPVKGYPVQVPGAWWNTEGRLDFEWLLHSLSVPWPPFVKEYYMIPVVASAGPNKSFGLYNFTPYPVGPADASGNRNTFKNPYPTSALWPNAMLPIQSPDPGVGDDSDNLYSYRLRLGARGD